MKLRHKINHGWSPPGEPYRTDARYDEEVAASLRKAEKQWMLAQRALRLAERIERARPNPDTRANLSALRAELVARFDHLNALRDQMEGTRGAKHSGRGSVRRVAQPRRSL